MKKTLSLSIGISLLALAISAPSMADEKEREDLIIHKTNVEEKVIHKEDRGFKYQRDLSKKEYKEKMMEKKNFSHKENMKKEKHKYKKENMTQYHKKDNKHMDKKHSQKHSSKIDVIDIQYIVTKKGEQLFNGYIALPAETEKHSATQKHQLDDMRNIPIGAITYSQRFNPLASKEKSASDTLFIEYNAEKDVVEFNIIENGKVLYQTGVDYKKGEGATRHLGDHKLHVTFDKLK